MKLKNFLGILLQVEAEISLNGWSNLTSNENLAIGGIKAETPQTMGGDAGHMHSLEVSACMSPRTLLEAAVAIWC